jgi:predicted Zn-dependent protease
MPSRHHRVVIGIGAAALLFVAVLATEVRGQSSTVQQGDYVDALIRATKTTLVSSDLTAGVTAVGTRLVSANELSREFDFQFHILNEEHPTAFSGPGGRIYIASGLLFRLDSVDLLAAALAHEIAHVQLEHARRQREMSQGASKWWSVGLSWATEIASMYAGYRVGLLVKDPAYQQQLGSLTSSVFDHTLSLKAYTLGTHIVSSFYGGYREEFEFEADDTGMRYLAAAGFDSTAMRRLFEILLEMEHTPTTRPGATLGLHASTDQLRRRVDRITGSGAAR